MISQSITSDEAAASSDRVSIAVVEAAADAAGVDPTALPPLYEWIDPDALDAVFGERSTGPPRTGEIAFDYAGYVVRVVRDRGITIAVEERGPE